MSIGNKLKNVFSSGGARKLALGVAFAGAAAGAEGCVPSGYYYGPRVGIGFSVAPAPVYYNTGYYNTGCGPYGDMPCAPPAYYSLPPPVFVPVRPSYRWVPPLRPVAPWRGPPRGGWR
jgi:hypothetical protein